jgi:hypothetical protein
MYMRVLIHQVKSVKANALDTQLANAAKHAESLASGSKQSPTTTSGYNVASLNLSRRLPPPSIAGGSGARSSEFNDEVNCFSSSVLLPILSKAKHQKQKHSATQLAQLL